MSSPAGWGPSHQTRRRRGRKVPWYGWLVAAPLFAVYWFLWRDWTGITVLLFVWVIVTWILDGVVGRAGLTRSSVVGTVIARTADPLLEARKYCSERGELYLGIEPAGDWQCSRRQRAVLLLGPPRSGKTSGVIIPAVISHIGPAVCTSTKPDVAKATASPRSRFGRVWVFDPTTSNPRGAGATVLRWSPIPASAKWDGALLMARAMTSAAGVGTGTTHGSHWAKRSQALLAPFLHAAALDGRDMEVVVDWLMRHELDEAGILLEQERASRLAFGSLLGILNTEDRERASIFSAAADALQAYNRRRRWMRRRTRTSQRTSSSPLRTRSTFTRRRSSRLERRRSCVGCWRRSAAPPTTLTPMER